MRKQQDYLYQRSCSHWSKFYHPVNFLKEKIRWGTIIFVSSRWSQIHESDLEKNLAPRENSSTGRGSWSLRNEIPGQWLRLFPLRPAYSFGWSNKVVSSRVLSVSQSSPRLEDCTVSWGVIFLRSYYTVTGRFMPCRLLDEDFPITAERLMANWGLPTEALSIYEEAQ